MTKLTIVVIMGGNSSEREVSLRSGTSVAAALASKGHSVLTLDLKDEGGASIEALKADAVFIAMHGRFGEDGTLQKQLEKLRIPYTGSNPEASRLGMDKVESKRLFKHKGLEVPPHMLLLRGDSVDVFQQCARSLGYPVVIKPRAEGSSIGVSLHRDSETLFEGAMEAFRYDKVALMEKFIAGREMTVGIVDNVALPPIELRPKRDFFTQEAKYSDPDTEYVVDPPLGAIDRKRILNAAVAAHHALGCDGATRVDLIFTPLHSVHVLEVNTIPGMTERSLLPKAARAAGIDYPELCDKMVRMALRNRRHGFGWTAAAAF